LGSDPVAAARFVEAVFLGELGVTFTPQGITLKPPSGSQMRWASMHEMTLGEKGSVFVGRSSGKIALFASSLHRAEADGAMKFLGCRRLVTPVPIEALVFWDVSSMLVCVGISDSGASSSGPCSWTLTIPMSGEALASSLFVDLEEFNQETCLWNRKERMRLLRDLQIRVELKPGAWRALRLAPATKEPGRQATVRS
jgi:hypothetical protein